MRQEGFLNTTFFACTLREISSKEILPDIGKWAGYMYSVNICLIAKKKTFTFLCFMTYQISGFLFLSYFLCVWMVYLHICQYTMFIQYSSIQKRMLDALGLELQTLISLRIEAEREADALKHRSIFPVPEYPSLLLLIATTTDWSQWLSKYSRNHCLESTMISILYR